MDVRVVIGLNVQKIRRERTLSQEELSFRSGLTRAYISGLEAGRRNPTVLSLTRLAAALDATLEELIRPIEHTPQRPALKQSRKRGQKGCGAS